MVINDIDLKACVAASFHSLVRPVFDCSLEYEVAKSLLLFLLPLPFGAGGGGPPLPKGSGDAPLDPRPTKGFYIFRDPERGEAPNGVHEISLAR